MICRSLGKRDEKLRRQAARKRNHWKKIGLALLVLAAFIGIVAAGNWYNSNHQRQPYVGPRPTNYQEGVLVNQTTTFIFDNEWNFLLRAGKNVTITVAFKDGVGADVAFSMNGPPYGDLVTPYPFSARLTSSNPTSTWSGVVQTEGSYRIELANISDENHPVTLQVFVEAV